ncbi:4-hydroxy-tetrahydrodipicolinate synthase, partial [candidate division TA06 bacterium]|nr:4-hydroxy-tetrahydrodipicolinate synthase [candidate division TA06 bacterium]
GMKPAGFDDLLGEVDYITLHMPLNEDTKYIIDKKSISKMKDGVRIINCARGGLIEEKELKVDGALVVAPYYNKPTQEGLYFHYKAVADAVDLPLVLYNIPGRTGVNVEPETIARLSELDRIIGVKEASGSLDQVSKILSHCGDQIAVLSGDDSLTLPMLAIGARGVISVIANIVPTDLSEMIHAFQKGNSSRAREIHQKLFPLTKTMFLETNPTPIKAAMDLLGMPAGDVRLPLVPLSEGNLQRLKETLSQYGLL